MKAKDWPTCTQPDLMLKRLNASTHRLKWVLFNCACCRRIWERMPDDACRNYVEAVERYALGTFKRKDLPPLKDLVLKAFRRAVRASRHEHSSAADAAGTVLNTTRYSAWNAARALAPPGRVAHRRERQAQCDLLREIIGNPYRPKVVEPNWLRWNGGIVANLAATILEGRRFAELPVLADALEEAGCTVKEILAHCRSRGEHVPGCWVIDLLLGKS